MNIGERSDLACEITAKENSNGINISKLNFSGIDVIKTQVTSKYGERATGRKMGIYYTLCCGNVQNFEEQHKKNVISACKEVINELNSKHKSILVAGLGNRFITADALGSITVDEITESPTRQNNKIYAIAPGTTGQSGLEAKEIIAAVCKEAQVDLLIVIDSLCARDIDRLGAIIQISNCGIVPGSGIGMHKKEISQSTLGLPVISIGVPTVISSSTLVISALKEVGAEKIPHKIAKILDTGSDFFVSPKEIDIIIQEYSKIISRGILNAFCNNS